MDNIKQLDYLFDPKSVAVIGASNTLAKWGFNILNLLLANGGREIYAVNKNETEVLGIPAYESIKEISGPVEFAVITVPFYDIISAMNDCVAKEVKTALIITGGLAECGKEGAITEYEAIDIARKAGIRVVGSNCMGHFNAYTNFFTTPFVLPVEQGPVSVISQSGNSGTAIVRSGVERGLGFSKFVSSGNETDLHFEDYLEYLAQDDTTEVILGYVEGFRQGRRFFELAREITKRKPIVIMKSGRTEAGSKAARSHTAAMAGAEEVCDAALKQCGVIRVDELNELIDVTLALVGQPLPKGRRVGVLSMGGGLGVISSDVLMSNGMELPALMPEAMEKLSSVLSGRWSHGNPVDPGGEFVNHDCIWPLLESSNIDSTVVVGAGGMADVFSGLTYAVPALEDHLEKLTGAAESRDARNLEKTIELMKSYQKPVMFVSVVSDGFQKREFYEKLEEYKIPPYPTPERAAKTLARLVEYSEYLGIAD